MIIISGKRKIMYISVIIYQEEVNVSKNSDECIREGGGDVTSMSTM